jgi:endonuclease/exonuclease/phosphatase family metal-dependent hydrolase
MSLEIPAALLAGLITLAGTGALAADRMPGGAGGAGVRDGCPLTDEGAMPHLAIEWKAAPVGAERARSDAWCAGVGPAVVLPAGGAAAVAGVDSILVVTWNVRVGGGDVDALVADLRSGRATGTPVTDFVLLLQEAYRAGDPVPAASRLARGARRIAAAPPSGDRSDIVAVAERLGLALLYVPSMRNGREPHDPREDRGNAILSTLPLVDPSALELPHEAQRRVAALATLRGLGSNGKPWSLRLASVHLDHRSRAGRGLASLGAARERQAASIVTALAPYPVVVVGGDLNSWSPWDRAPQLLRASFPAAPDHDRRPTLVAGPLQLRLDYLLFRATGPVRPTARMNDRYGSDHHPVLGWLAVSAADDHAAFGGHASRGRRPAPHLSSLAPVP